MLRHDIEEGFCHPLNEWLGEDADGDGKLSDAEAKWPGWKDVPPLWRDVATKDGKVYAVPTPGFAYYGLIYRKDLVKAAGLDPESPPRTWADFAAWCEKLTFGDKTIPGAAVQRGQRALGIENRPWGGRMGGVLRRAGMPARGGLPEGPHRARRRARPAAALAPQRGGGPLRAG